MHQIKIGKITIGDKNPLALIAGPCVIESEDFCMDMARRVRDIAGEAGVPYIFKSSYDKANRMSIGSFRGPGIRKGLDILQKVKDKVNVPVLSDVHAVEEVALAKEVLDIIQIPAFLCRQTDLILAAARTDKVVNIKKGQFLAPWDMAPIIKKVESTGNHSILLTERGYSFGYNNLVTDFRSIAIMRNLGYPVVYDATHSIQIPGGKGTSSGGQKEFAAGLSRAAAAFGCDGLFLEVHASPDTALCDGPNMLDLNELEKLVKQVKHIEKAVKTTL
jgi:2-dehydro-3-deoxyphosphooctonate aldolase (KDO 8-P synthase)